MTRMRLCVLYNVNSNSNHCLLSELPSASTRVRHTRAVAAAHLLEFEVSRSRTSQFSRCFRPVLVRMWNDLPYIIFGFGYIYILYYIYYILYYIYYIYYTLYYIWLWFVLYQALVFPTWACAAGFNNNNNKCRFCAT